MRIRKQGLEGWICLMAEVLFLAYRTYLLFFSPISGDLVKEAGGGFVSFIFFFMWAGPAALLGWSYLEAARWGDRASSGESFGWGIAVATFGCLITLAFANGTGSFAARSEVIGVALAHVGFPLAVLAYDKFKDGTLRRVLSQGDGAPTASSVGRLALNATLSVAAVAVGVWLTGALVQTGIFGNSVIFIGFIPITGMVFYATPLVLTVFALLAIWGRK